MDKINLYKSYINELLLEYAAHYQDDDGITAQILKNEENRCYCLMSVGWDSRNKRVHGCVFHVDIINDKIWVQDDWTEYGIARELMDRGVPKTDIVLAFVNPERRAARGEFAVG